MNTEPPVLEDDPIDLSISDIYEQLQLTNELILTIPAEEEHALRKGLAIVKTRQNAKLKDNGIVPDKLTLKYNVVEHKNDQGERVAGIIDIQISLVPRSGITVLKMRVPDPNL